DLSSKNKRHGEVYCWQQTRSKLGTIQSSVSLDILALWLFSFLLVLGQKRLLCVRLSLQLSLPALPCFLILTG
ncbi:mCG1044750, isoform CRA_b, partial [Mus musculus]